MPTILQLRRGTTAENDAYTGSVGELTVDTDLNKLRLHDGSTAGGDTIGNGSGNIQIGVTGNNEIDTSSGNLTIDSAGGTVTVDDNLTVSGNLIVSGTTTTVDSTTIEVQNQLVFEGSTSDDFELTLTAGDPTADRTITLPDTTDTLVGKATTDTLTNKTLGATTIAGHLTPDTNETYDLGSSSFKFRDIYLSGTSINLGDATITADGSSIVLPAGTTVSGGNGAAVDLNSTQTLTNKTIDASSNTLSNIANTSLTNSTITLAGDSGSQAIDLGDTLTIEGTSNEIETSQSGDTLTIGLPDDVTIGQDLSVSRNLTVTGNLTVNGTTTTVNTTNTTVSDSILELATGTTGTPANDAGIVIERGDSNNAFIGFDESADKFVVGTGTFTGATSGDLTITTGTLVANLEATTATLGGSDVISTDNTKTLTNKTIDASSNTLSNIGNSSLTNSTFTIQGSDSSTDAVALGETLVINNGEGIVTAIASNTLTITGEDATTSNKGIASFSSDNFAVSSGAVTVTTIDGGTF